MTIESPSEAAYGTVEVDVSSELDRQAEMILSAMDAGGGPASDNRPLTPRENLRQPFRVRARLRLFSDADGTPPWTLFVRDADQRGIGFITPHRLPLGYGGWIELPTPAGRVIKVHCTLFRCREAVKGWYDGALYFNREQFAFEVKRTE